VNFVVIFLERNRMKHFVRLTAMVVCLVVESVCAQTQKVQTVTINLIGTQQNTNSLRLSGAKIANRNIIRALAGTNGTFSSHARLVAITEGGSTGIFIRDKIGNQTIDTDVTGNFSNSTLLSLSSADKTLETSIQTFSFSSDLVSFDVQGFTVGNTRSDSEISNVNGVGLINGSPAALRGTIALTPFRPE
jgi:hypothetical protein